MAEQPTQGTGPLDPWEVFEARLTAYVTTMIDPSDEDRLVLHVPTSRSERGETLVEIGLLDQARMFTVDFAFDSTGGYPDDVREFTHRITETIQSCFDPPHPGLMTVEVEGPAAGGVAVLGLPLHDEVPTGEPDSPEQALGWPESRDELVAMVLEHLRSSVEHPVEVDADGDVPVVVDGVGLWVRVEEAAPMLHLFTKVVDGVHSRRQSGVELNAVNRDHRWSRWVRHDRDIWQELHVSAYPFVPDVLDTMLSGFATDYHAVRTDLADRLGGKACQ